MKITRTFFMLLLGFFLAGCKQEEVIEDITLELVGDSTVRIEEGTEYVDLGVLVNGEKADYLGYYSSININKVGTYYVKYEYMGEELLRTVEVYAGARTELLGIISSFAEADNFAYTLDLDVRFSRGGTDFYTFDHKAYDVYGNYRFGSHHFTSSSMNEHVQQAYIYIDEANLVEDNYMYDEHSMWYHAYRHFPRPNTNVTDFILENIKTTTKEVFDDKIVYSAFLNAEDYLSAYHTKINLMPDDHFEHETSEYITVEITVVDGNITRIETDLTSVMKNALSIASLSEITEYKYVYTFSKYGEIEEIIIPDEGIEAKEAQSQE